MRTHKLTTIAVVGSALLFVTGCSTGGPVAAPTQTANETPSAVSTPTETSDPTPTEAAPPVEEAIAPTCENIVSADVLAEMQGFGWIPTLEPWVLPGDVEAGILCTWDLTSPPAPADSASRYGWAALTPGEEAQVIAALGEDAALIREEVDGDLRFVSPDGPNTDAEGFGYTFIFSGGNVRYSITKADALTVIDPQ